MKKFVTAAAALAVALPAGHAAAADYPTKPVSLMIAYSPGGATDFQARIVTMVAANKGLLQQPIVILNRPGAGGKGGLEPLCLESHDRRLPDGGLQRAALHRPVDQVQDQVQHQQSSNRSPTGGADPAVLVVNKNSKFNSVEGPGGLGQGQSRQGDGLGRRPVRRPPHRLPADPEGAGREAALRPAQGRRAGPEIRARRPGDGGRQQPVGLLPQPAPT